MALATKHWWIGLGVLALLSVGWLVLSAGDRDQEETTASHADDGRSPSTTDAGAAGGSIADSGPGAAPSAGAGAVPMASDGGAPGPRAGVAQAAGPGPGGEGSLGSSASTGPASNRPAGGSGDDGGGEGSGDNQLTDRTGRGGNLASQLNSEFMPLASECIGMAQERNPKLEGLLSIAVNLVPLEEAGKVLIESVELQADNEIRDPELIECITQTTLSIEIEERESFAISMPIAPEDDG